MGQLKAGGVEGLPPEPIQYGAQLGIRPLRVPHPVSINRVPQERVIDVRHMHPDLVRPATLQLAADMTESAEATLEPVMGDGGTPVWHHRHFLALFRVAPNRFINAPTTGQLTHAHGLVLTPHAPFLKLLHQGGVGLQATSHDHDAAGVLVQPMHDARPRDPFQLRGMVEQRIDQRPGLMPCRGVDNQPRWLVHHDQVVIFMDDIEINGLRLPAHFRYWRGSHFNLVIHQHPVAGPAFLPIHRQFARPHPPLDAGTGMFRHQLRNSLIQPLVAEFRRYAEACFNTLCAACHQMRRPALCWFRIMIPTVTMAVKSHPSQPQYTGNRMTRRVPPHNAQGTRPHTGGGVVACVLTALLIAGCASTGEDEKLPQEKYYEQARSSMNAGNFESAQNNLEALETYYPFGRYAEQAQLDLIYARYQNLDLQGARSAADRFLRLNPQSENADYALYMRGIASYYMDLGLAARYFPIEVDARDPGQQRQAFDDFSRLLNRYPESEYAADARQRMIAIRNRMAGKELAAAEYYIKREAYIAALNRARAVVENYSQTPAAEEALVIMAEMYARLGLDQERADTVRVLAQNFPQTQALDDDGQFIRQSFGIQDRSLASVLTFGLLGGPKEAQ